MRYLYFFPLLVLSRLLCIPMTHESQTSQTQVLIQLIKHLEFPSSSEIWGSYEGHLCNLSSSSHMSIKCEGNSVTELKIMRDRVHKVSEFNGFAIPNLTLSESFSIDSLITTLTRLTRLRVLSLVSLGIWGKLPDKIHRLSLLEALDLSSNFLFGSIPPKLSTMKQLHILTLDGNYFNGSLPDWFDSLPNLNFLSLKNNRLNGQFSSSICSLKKLAHISFSHNKLHGRLPNLSALSDLNVLDLRENHLDSELPVMPKGLVTILLGNNRFSGEILEQFEDLSELQHLDLSSNNLRGLPPSALFTLPKISYLTLAYNKLSGSLPNDLSCAGTLGFVDISSNKLLGGLPACLANSSDTRVVKYGGNCLSIHSQCQHQVSYCEEVSGWRKESQGWRIAAVVTIISGAVLFTVLLAIGGLFLGRRYHHSKKTFRKQPLPKIGRCNSASSVSSKLLLANVGFISQALKLGTRAHPFCRLFSMEELKEATNNFNKLAFIGQGSIGELYKGWLENGTCITVRILHLPKKYSIQNLKVRLDLLSKLHHPHLVDLLGHCIDGCEQDDSSGQNICLVYEYVPNGNFQAHLSENCPEKELNWSDRLAILIGVAKAVHFLHTGIIPGCFRNQLKTKSILLDENYIAKLSDYGMSIIIDESEKLEGKGKGKVPKACQKRKSEDDVYDFGFVLLESLVRPVASREVSLLNETASFEREDFKDKLSIR